MFLPRTIAAAPIRRPVGGSAVLSSTDFTYLGAYRVPRDPMTGYESIFGNGLALRRESADLTNPVHLLSCGYKGTGVNHGVYEWRDATPEYQGGNTVLTDYTSATVMKTYADVYSGKKTIIYNGVEQQLGVQNDGGFGIYWDATDSRLYWCYGFGYSTSDPLDVDSWHIGYSTLNYAANTGAGTGPWRLSGQSWKSAMGGLVGVPSAYATDHLSGKRLAVGVGGYYSIHAIADASMGPSLTAFAPIEAAEETAIANTPLVGYWPFAASPTGSNGRALRPENITFNATSHYNLETAWGAQYMSWKDRIRGAVWIDTGTKRGVVFFGQYSRGYVQYVSSDMYASRFGHMWAVYDPNDFTPVSSTARYAVQPDSVFDVQYPTIDYTQTKYAGGAQKTVSAITSTNGAALSSDTGALVTVSDHGYTAETFVEIRGADQAEYNAIWQIAPGGILNANQFYIRNASLGAYTWSGTPATGTITAKYPISSNPDDTLGAAYDATSGLLYVAVSVGYGVNGISSHVMIHVYEVG